MLTTHFLTFRESLGQLFGRVVGLSLLSTALALAACDISSTPASQERVTIAINPWPSFEFLYLANHLGYFEDTGINIKLVQSSSLSDIQRSYINGRVDGIASTMVEVVQASQLSNHPISVVLVTDYSNGGDVIIAKKNIQNIRDLKGLTVGAEVGSLGLFIVDRALRSESLTLDDVTLKNIAQHEGEKLLLAGQIDAYVSYAPYSVRTLQNEGVHTIFDTSQIPYEVVDTIAIRKSILQQDPDIARKIQRAWQLALDYTRDNPQQAYTIMAERQGITPDEFEHSVKGLKMLDLKDNQKLFTHPEAIQKIALEVCTSLHHARAFTQSCDTLDNVVHHY